VQPGETAQSTAPLFSPNGAQYIDADCSHRLANVFVILLNTIPFPDFCHKAQLGKRQNPNYSNIAI